MRETGILLIIFSLILLSIGALLTIFSKVPFLGKLPGDILIKKDNFTFFFLLTTSILISLILSLIPSLLNKWR